RSGRQHGQERKCECLADPAWSKTLACRYALCTGTGRSPTWPLQKSWSGPHREGEESKPMKHGQEKSDLFIIALKPTNKPGRLGAELAEPRERTEGNMGEQHTYRTLRRISVSQRLDCVREAARGIRRKSPEVGARCVNPARRDLCGGHPAMDVPT